MSVQSADAKMHMRVIAQKVSVNGRIALSFRWLKTSTNVYYRPGKGVRDLRTLRSTSRCMLIFMCNHRMTPTGNNVIS